MPPTGAGSRAYGTTLGNTVPSFRGEQLAAEHAGVGAVLAHQRKLIPIAFAIAGHHSGLANPQIRANGAGLPLRDRLATNGPALEAVRSTIPAHLLEPGVEPSLPLWAQSGATASRVEQDEVKRSVEFWTRMLFSALVDADRLATEHFYSPDK